MCYHASPLCVGAATATLGQGTMQGAKDSSSSLKTRATYSARAALVCNRNATEFKPSPNSISVASRISNSNKTSFKISPNPSKTHHILISNRNITPRVAIRKSAVAVNKSAVAGYKSASAISFSPGSRDLNSPEIHALSTSAAISNRQRLARLETISNSQKTKARRDF